MGVLSHAYSGKHGRAYQAATGGMPTIFHEVTGWKIEPKIDAPKHNSSLTNGVKVPIAGSMEWGGTIDVMIQEPGAIPFQEGDWIDIICYSDDSLGNGCSGTILITEAPIDCDINGGKEVSVAYKFEGASVLTRFGNLSKGGGSSSGSP